VLDLDDAYTDYVAQVTAALAADGLEPIKVIADPAQLDPPCVHIGQPSPTLTTVTRITTGTATFPVWLLGPTGGGLSGAAWLRANAFRVMAAAGLVAMVPALWRGREQVEFEAFTGTAAVTIHDP
jgi:hypothetical protein